MIKKFKKSELLILFVAIILIFISEYYFVVLKDYYKEIFLGLWPPTILLLLIYLNSKKQK